MFKKIENMILESLMIVICFGAPVYVAIVRYSQFF